MSSDHIGLHIRAVGEWTNRLLNFFEKEQKRLHDGEVPAYDDQMAHEMEGKHPIEAFVVNSKCDKIDERSDGTMMKNNIIMAVKDQEDMSKTNMKVPMEKALSMPDMETRMKNSERFKK